MEQVQPSIEDMHEIEIWISVKGYEELYEVSNMGNVRVRDRLRKSRHGMIKYPSKNLKPKRSKFGYLCVNLYRNGKGNLQYIHALGAKTFVKGNMLGYEG